MSVEKELLPSIFESSLSLDAKKGGNPRSLHLFERMASRLDEIAANTRAWGKEYGSGAGEHSSGRCDSPQRGKNSSLKAALADIRERIASGSRDEISKTAGSGRKKRDSRSGHSSLASNQAVENSQGRISSLTGSQRKPAQKKLPQGNPAVDAVSGQVRPKSAIANSEAQEKRIAEENGSRIAEAVSGGLKKLGGLLKAGSQAVARDGNLKEAAGYGLGGPFYGALKEIKEALPDFSFNKNDDEKKRKTDAKNIADAFRKGDGRPRDEKGRFIKPDPNEARRQIAQTEVAEAHLALDEKESKKEDKRHKELIRAVRANKRGMLDRFLDRRMGLGRRNRIIRERMSGSGRNGASRAANARGSRFDSDLSPNRDSRNRFGRGRDVRPPNRSRGILGRATGAVRSVGRAATGTLAMGGRALGGMLRALPGIGQAIALGMAAYEGFQGWNDKKLHKQAFGLKDGQEASTGQKASAAAASILDMGGLTSGLLNMFGIEFDKAGVARSIYELGSNIGQMAKDFIANAGPILTSVWNGISDIGAKAWAGAKNIGGAIANVAGGIWEKGASLVSGIWQGAQNIAGSVAKFAGDALEKGAGMLAGLWEGYTGIIGKIWGGLWNFAKSAIAKGGEILSNLWKGLTELPGKIFDGATNLAKGALESGSQMLSDGWNAVKGWGSSLFGADEEKAEEAKPPVEEIASGAKNGVLVSETMPVSNQAEQTTSNDTAEASVTSPLVLQS